MLLPSLLVFILFLALITKAKIDTDTVTDTEVFFGQKPAKTYRTLNCQYRSSISTRLVWRRLKPNLKFWRHFKTITTLTLSFVSFQDNAFCFPQVIHAAGTLLNFARYCFEMGVWQLYKISVINLHLYQNFLISKSLRVINAIF